MNFVPILVFGSSFFACCFFAWLAVAAKEEAMAGQTPPPPVPVEASGALPGEELQSLPEPGPALPATPGKQEEPDLPEAPPRESPDPAGFDGKERHPLAEGLYPWFEGGQSIHWAITDQADPYLLGPVVVEVVPATAGQDETFVQLDLEFPPSPEGFPHPAAPCAAFFCPDEGNCHQKRAR